METLYWPPADASPASPSPFVPSAMYYAKNKDQSQTGELSKAGKSNTNWFRHLSKHITKHALTWFSLSLSLSTSCCWLFPPWRPVSLLVGITVRPLVCCMYGWMNGCSYAYSVLSLSRKIKLFLLLPSIIISLHTYACTGISTSVCAHLYVQVCIYKYVCICTIISKCEYVQVCIYK